MPLDIHFSDDEAGTLEQGGGLKPNTIFDKEWIISDFNHFVSDSNGGRSISVLVSEYEVQLTTCKKHCFFLDF